MLLSLQKQEFGNIKEVACYRQQFQFLNVGLTLCSDTNIIIDVFSSIYQKFFCPVQPENSILCYSVKNACGTEKLLTVIDGAA
jgi:hypothetical protein